MLNPTEKKKSNKSSAYILKQTLGKGTFGEVKLGIHKKTQMKVAIKILEKKKIKTSEDKRRIDREFKILKTLNHPNICKLYEIIEEEEKILVIMEHAEKGDLFNYIVDQKKMPEKESNKFFLQLLSALNYMHSLNIMHRDIKPENILIFGSGHKKYVKFIDFGLSDKYNKGYNIKTACGSPSYAAPEILAGKAYNGLKADVWSLGIVLFAMVCGYLPFEENDEQKLFEKIVNSYFHIPSFVSTLVSDLLKKLLEKNPKKRLGIREVFEHPWCEKFSDEFFCEEFEDFEFLVGIMEREFFFDLDREEVRRNLEVNEHNKITTFYYLLKKKYEGDVELKKTFDGNLKKRDTSMKSIRSNRRSLNKLRIMSTDRKKEVRFNSYNENILKKKIYLNSKKKKKSKSKINKSLFMNKIFNKMKFMNFENKNYLLKDNKLNIYYTKKNNVKKNLTEKKKQKIKIFKVKKSFGNSFFSISKNKKSISNKKKFLFQSFRENIKLSPRKNHKNKNNKLEIHSGVINIKAIFNKEPNFIIKDLKKILKKMKIFYKSYNKFTLEIKKNEIPLKIFLMGIENLKGCYILKLKSDDIDKLTDYTFFDKILSELNK